MFHTHEDGFIWPEIVDNFITPTVSEENIGQMKNEFARYFPNATISILNNNEIKFSLQVDSDPPHDFGTRIEVLEDGTYQWNGVPPHHDGGFYRDIGSLSDDIKYTYDDYASYWK